MHADDKILAVLQSDLQEGIEVKRRVMEQSMAILQRITAIIREAIAEGHKLLLFGNGGSAADSQHIAAEFVSKFNLDRQAMPAVALTTDTSILTSISNDYAFDQVFARQIEALGRKGDIALGISTSGNSPNVLNAINKAKEMGLVTIGFTGSSGGMLKDAAENCFCVPSSSTPRIQEVHISVAHAICGYVEETLCRVHRTER